MTDAFDARLARRFLRTLRVSTGTALAEYELTAGRAVGAAPAVFRALAAKGADGWRFPEAGLAAADGLVVALVSRSEAGAPARLLLQAQGSAGLQAYAGHRARISFGPFGPEAEVAFDADGRAALALTDLAIEEDDLAAFDLALLDEAP